MTPLVEVNFLRCHSLAPAKRLGGLKSETVLHRKNCNTAFFRAIPSQILRVLKTLFDKIRHSCIIKVSIAISLQLNSEYNVNVVSLAALVAN